MSWCILVFESVGKLYPFTCDARLYQSMRETLSSEEGSTRYGMKFVAGTTNIPDEQITPIRERIQELLELKMLGQPVDLETELDAMQ